jgi:deoxyribose-phosphate aldolase
MQRNQNKGKITKDAKTETETGFPVGMSSRSSGAVARFDTLTTDGADEQDLIPTEKKQPAPKAFEAG